MKVGDKVQIYDHEWLPADYRQYIGLEARVERIFGETVVLSFADLPDDMATLYMDEVKPITPPDQQMRDAGAQTLPGLE